MFAQGGWPGAVSPLALHGNDALSLLLSPNLSLCCAHSLAAAARRTSQTYGSQKLKWEKGYLNEPQRLWNGITMP